MTTPPSPNNNDGQDNSIPSSADNGYEAPGAYPTSATDNDMSAGNERPKNYLVWAILSTVLFCLPIGIASIVFATRVNSKWDAGDIAGAQAASANAKKWAIIGAVCGIVIQVVYLILTFTTGGATGSS